MINRNYTAQIYPLLQKTRCYLLTDRFFFLLTLHQPLTRNYTLKKQMKHLGSKSEFEEERNSELLKTYHRLISEAEQIVPAVIYNKLVNQPSSRFWVTEERAAVIISKMRKGHTLERMHPNKREMFQEIYRRAIELLEKDNTLSVLDVAMKVVNQPAPKFYICEGYAEQIIGIAKKKCYEERKRRLRHLF